MNNVIRRYIRRYIEEKKKAPLRSAFLASPVFLSQSFLLIFLRSSSRIHFLTSPILFHPLPFSSVLFISISIYLHLSLSIPIYLIHHIDTLNINIVFFVFRMREGLTQPMRGGSIPWRTCRVVSIIRGRAARSRL